LQLWILLPALLVACSRAQAPAGRVAASGRAPLRIAYNVLVDAEADDYDVFSMDLSGGDVRNLTSHPAVDWVYNVLGDRLFLVSDRGQPKRRYLLCELGADGAGFRAITDFHVRDSWVGIAADGERLVVSSQKDGTPDLYLIDRAGAVLRRITDDEARDRDPLLLPDGVTLVWVSYRSGADELWSMPLDGTSPARRLTHFPEGALPEGVHGYHAGPPRWNPTDGTISFCSQRGEQPAIWSIRSDGSGLASLVEGGCWHDWSPDGRWLAYDAADQDGNHDIYLRDASTGETRRLTTGLAYEQGPVFVHP
jgi:TolB protein